jgi:hypothetical protein
MIYDVAAKATATDIATGVANRKNEAIVHIHGVFVDCRVLIPREYLFGSVRLAFVITLMPCGGHSKK